MRESLRHIGNGVGKVLDRVPGWDTGVVLDLVTTTKARNGDGGIAPIANSRKEAVFADGLGDVVMFDFVAKRAGHPATAAIDFMGVVLRTRIQNSHGVLGSRHRLLVTVPVVKQLTGRRFAKMQQIGRAHV